MKTIGIDLGTTNSVAAVERKPRPLAADPDGGTRLPSVVSFPPSGARFVGTVARRRRAIDPRNTVYSSKRIIGESWHAATVDEFKKSYPFVLVNDDGAPRFSTRQGDYTATEIATMVVEALCENTALDPHAHTAVVGVPSGFRDFQREATRTACSAAGFTAVHVVEEPVATALAYLGRTGHGVKRAAVYDLGGGTFDMAVVDCTESLPRVLGCSGDLYLGGDDIDRALADWVREQVLRTHGWDLRDELLTYDRLVMECERVKIRLCYTERARVELSQVDPAAPAAVDNVPLDRRQLAELCRDLVMRTFGLCDEVLSAAGVRTSDLDAVFLAGGTSQLPMLQEDLAKYFGQKPRCEFDPSEVVAVGASVADESLRDGHG